MNHSPIPFTPAAAGVETGEPPPPRPGYYLAVVGANSCPEPYVHRQLDRLTERVRAGHQLVLVSGGEPACSAWCKRYDLPHELEFPDRGLYGRFAGARWAMRVCAVAGGILVFGPPDRWRQLLRYAADAGVPYRVIPAPAGSREG